MPDKLTLPLNPAIAQLNNTPTPAPIPSTPLATPSAARPCREPTLRELKQLGKAGDGSPPARKLQAKPVTLCWPNQRLTSGVMVEERGRQFFQPRSQSKSLLPRLEKGEGRIAYVPDADSADAKLLEAINKNARMLEVNAWLGNPQPMGRPLVTPSLAEVDLGKFDMGQLKHLSNVSSGTKNGVDIDQRQALQMFTAGVLQEMAGLPELNPVSLGNALAALERPFVHFTYSMAFYEARPYEPALFFNGPPTDPLSVLQALPPGGHQFLNFCIGSQLVKHDGTDESTAHALAVSVTKVHQEAVKLTIINSNGWGHALDIPQFGRSQTLSKTMSPELALEGLTQLCTGQLGQPDSAALARHWADPACAAPLANWLQCLGGPGYPTELAAKPVSPQKSGDCGIEVMFAWLSSVLPRSDYKLVKATVLHNLAKVDELTGQRHAGSDRLGERITSALGGHMTST